MVAIDACPATPLQYEYYQTDLDLGACSERPDPCLGANLAYRINDLYDGFRYLVCILATSFSPIAMASDGHYDPPAHVHPFSLVRVFLLEKRCDVT